jgi:hypothetical protein
VNIKKMYYLCRVKPITEYGNKTIMITIPGIDPNMIANNLEAVLDLPAEPLLKMQAKYTAKCKLGFVLKAPLTLAAVLEPCKWF